MKKVSVTIADTTQAACELARAHLSGPVAAHYLAKGTAAAALLGAEMPEGDETLVLQMKCQGPLGGLVVECTAAGTLRGYTEKKTLDGFDGMGEPDDDAVLGRERQIQVTRSAPGRMISQAAAASLGEYLSRSLQRRASIFLEAAVSDESEVLYARGVLVEALPDSDIQPPGGLKSAAVSSRGILKRLGLEAAELKESVPLSFACRCSPERAAGIVAALPEGERAALPETVDITCHMCGRTFKVRTR